MASVATLGLKVESGDVVTATDRLDKLSSSAAKAGSSTDKASNDVNKVGRAASSAAASTTKLSGASKALGNNMSIISNNGSRAAGIISSLAKAAAALGVAFAANTYARLADQWSDMNSRLRLATGSMEAGRDAMSRLNDIARITYSSIDVTVESFLRASTSLRELGYSTAQTLDYTEALNNAMVVSGAKGERAEMVANALGRAMAAGALRGNELNTIIENGGRVSELLAAELGVATNQLRALGADGKITGDIIYSSLVGNMSLLRDEADSMDATIADGFVLLGNAVLRVVGEFDQATGASGAFAQALVGLADIINGLPETQFFSFMVEFFQEGQRYMEATAREVNAVAGAFGALGSAIANSREEVTMLSDASRMSYLNEQVVATTAQFGQLVDEVLALDSMQTSSVRGQLVMLKEDVESGWMTAEQAHKALIALGNVDPDFSMVGNKLVSLSAMLADLQSAAWETAKSIASVFNASLGQDTDMGGDIAYGDYMKDMGFYTEDNTGPMPPSRPLGWGSIDVSQQGASGGGGRSGGGAGGEGVRTGLTAQLETMRAEVAEIQSLYLTENEAMQQAFLEKMLLIDTARNLEILSLEEHNALMESIEREHSNRMLELQLMPYADALGAIGGLMGDIASVVGENNSSMLAAQKVFGIASALISMYVGAAKALELPFPANIGAMATVLAQGMKLVSGIKSGSSSAGSGGASSAARPQTPAATPESTKQAINIHLDGEDDFLSKKTVVKLMESINELNKDGHLLIVSGP